MAVTKIEQRYIKKSGNTFYWNSKILPKKYRADMFALYNFVHTARDFALHKPSQLKKLAHAYEKAIEDSSFEQIAHSWDEPAERALKHIVRLVHKYKFDPNWVSSFFSALTNDAEKNGYPNYETILKYLEGSAESVGLMVSRILDLGESAEQGVRAQARAIAWLAIISNAVTDHDHGFSYFPRNELKAYNLKDASRDTAKTQAYDYKRFIQFELKRYYSWQSSADRSLKELPNNLVEAFSAIAWIHRVTAEKIKKDPLIITNKKVRPHKVHLLWEGVKRKAHKTAIILAAQEKPAVKK